MQYTKEQANYLLRAVGWEGDNLRPVTTNIEKYNVTMNKTASNISDFARRRNTIRKNRERKTS